MRLDGHDVVTDHDLLTDVAEDDHHQPVVEERILVNSLAIGPGTYELRISLGRSGCKTVRAILRGTVNVDIQGHTGVFVVGTDSAGESSSMGIAPYPSGTQSYMGAYSVLHGDGSLSLYHFGQGVIRLDDVWIDGDEAVFEFFNSYPSARNLQVYGVCVCK